MLDSLSPQGGDRCLTGPEGSQPLSRVPLSHITTWPARGGGLVPQWSVSPSDHHHQNWSRPRYPAPLAVGELSPETGEAAALCGIEPRSHVILNVLESQGAAEELIGHRNSNSHDGGTFISGLLGVLPRYSSDTTTGLLSGAGGGGTSLGGRGLTLSGLGGLRPRDRQGTI